MSTAGGFQKVRTPPLRLAAGIFRPQIDLVHRTQVGLDANLGEIGLNLLTEILIGHALNRGVAIGNLEFEAVREAALGEQFLRLGRIELKPIWRAIASVEPLTPIGR